MLKKVARKRPSSTCVPDTDSSFSELRTVNRAAAEETKETTEMSVTQQTVA